MSRSIAAAPSRRHEMPAPDRPRCFLALLAAALALPCPVARAEDPISLLYTERPPFAITEPDGTVRGVVATPAAEALQRAGIPFSWETIPTNRSLFEIRENRGRFCGLGWYMTPERAEFARFSEPISQDGPLVALAGRSYRDTPPGTFEALLHDNTIRFVLKTGVLYTTAASSLLDTAKIRARWTTDGWPQIVQLVAEQNYDMTLVIEEEADFYVESGRFQPGDLRILRFPELPGGELRRLMCSKQVDEQTLSAFNAALKQR
jgi:polar amino acid transport system substrate-binding protein